MEKLSMFVCFWIALIFAAVQAKAEQKEDLVGFGDFVWGFGLSSSVVWFFMIAACMANFMQWVISF